MDVNDTPYVNSARFREFAEKVQASAKQLAESQWMRVGNGINETIEDATAIFEDGNAIQGAPASSDP